MYIYIYGVALFFNCLTCSTCALLFLTPLFEDMCTYPSMCTYPCLHMHI